MHMPKSIAQKIKLAALFDKQGKYKKSDRITSDLVRMAQYYTRFDVNKHDHVFQVPYDDLESEFENADEARLDKMQRLTPPDSYQLESEVEEVATVGLSLEGQLSELNGEASFTGGITYIDPGPTTKAPGMDESANDGSLDNFTWEETYQKNVDDGKGYLNLIPR
jgi:hypothetical protein